MNRKKGWIGRKGCRLERKEGRMIKKKEGPFRNMSEWEGKGWIDGCKGKERREGRQKDCLAGRMMDEPLQWLHG